jgi:hypothetical protein
MGLPWYGGRPKKREAVLSMAEEAIKIGQGALEVLEAITPVERQAEHAGELLLQGMQSGLAVGTHICERYVRMARADPDAFFDPKMERLASDTAGWMTRLGAKVMEEAFRRRRDDTVGKLLEQLKVAESGKSE